MITPDTGPLMLVVSPGGALRTTRLPLVGAEADDALNGTLGGAVRVVIRRIPPARAVSTSRPQIAMWCMYLAEDAGGLPVNDPATVLARALGWEGPPDSIRGAAAFLGHNGGRLGDVRPEVIHLAGRLILGEPWLDVPAGSGNRRAAPLEVPAPREPAEPEAEAPEVTEYLEHLERAETGPLERLEPEAEAARRPGLGGWLRTAYDAVASDPLPARPPEAEPLEPQAAERVRTVFQVRYGRHKIADIPPGKRTGYAYASYEPVSVGDIVEVPGNWLDKQSQEATVVVMGTHYLGEIAEIVRVLERLEPPADTGGVPVAFD